MRRVSPYARALLSLTTVVLVLAGTVPVPAQGGRHGPGGFAEYFDAQIPAYLSDHGIAGAVVAVVEDGEPVHLAGYGFADVERGVAMDADTVVHIGSAGKTFTAVAAMQLVERGQLDLDADVATYIDFAIPATYPEPITVRHLLTHTSGFEAHDLGVLVLDAGALTSSRDYLARNLPKRVRPPGAAIGYSNYGMALLGYVVERLSGLALSDYLETAVITPLGMARTSARAAPDGPTGGVAVGHSRSQPQPTEYVAAFGAAPVRSTAADMGRYMSAVLGLGRLGEAHILQPDTAGAMLAQQYAAAPGLNGIGFGFYEMSRNGQRILGHLGTMTCFHSLMLLFPDRQLGVFVSFNSAEGAQVLRTGRFMDDFMDRFFPQTTAAAVPPADFAARAGEYAGTYFWNNRFGRTTIEKLLFLTDAVAIQPTADGRLRLAAGGAGRTYTETAPDRFVRSDGQDVLVFHRDVSRGVTGASLGSRAVFTLERRPWYESPPLTIGALIATGIVFLLGLAINGAYLRRGGEATQSRLAVAGRWSAVLMPLLNLGFIAGLALLLPGLLQGRPPGPALRVVLLLPPVAAALTLVLAGATLVRWRDGSGSLFLRLQRTVLVAAGMLFPAVLSVWNLLGWRF